MSSFCLGQWEIMGIKSRLQYFREQTAQLCIKLEEHMCKSCSVKCSLSYLMEGGGSQKLEECRRKLFGTLRELGESRSYKHPQRVETLCFSNKL